MARADATVDMMVKIGIVALSLIALFFIIFLISKGLPSKVLP